MLQHALHPQFSFRHDAGAIGTRPRLRPGDGSATGRGVPLGPHRQKPASMPRRSVRAQCRRLGKSGPVNDLLPRVTRRMHHSLSALRSPPHELERAGPASNGQGTVSSCASSDRNRVVEHSGVRTVHCQRRRGCRFPPGGGRPGVEPPMSVNHLAREEIWFLPAEDEYHVVDDRLRGPAGGVRQVRAGFPPVGGWVVDVDPRDAAGVSAADRPDPALRDDH